jgi:Ca2+-binding EF-hand superfamily protein
MARSAEAAGAGGRRTARQVFERYDTNGDGVLDQNEVAVMIDDIGYQVDDSYVGGVMDIFGRFDQDQNGTIDLGEFPRLWEHLGGEALAPEASPPPAPAPAPAPVPAPAPAPATPSARGAGGRRLPRTARQVFERYDTNGDGVLDQNEVSAMIDDIGYQVDDSYVGRVMDIFGRFDQDRNGTIDADEFVQLWKHLGGEPFVVEPAPAPAPAPASSFNSSPLQPSSGRQKGSPDRDEHDDSSAELKRQALESGLSFADVRGKSDGDIRKLMRKKQGSSDTTGTGRVGTTAAARQKRFESTSYQAAVSGQLVSGGDVPTKAAPDSKRKARAALLSGLHSGRLEAAVSEMEAATPAPSQTPPRRPPQPQPPPPQPRSRQANHPQLPPRDRQRMVQKLGSFRSTQARRGLTPMGRPLITGNRKGAAAAAAAAGGSRPPSLKLAMHTGSSSSSSSSSGEVGKAVVVCHPDSPHVGKVGCIVPQVVPSRRFVLVQLQGAEKPTPLQAASVRACSDTEARQLLAPAGIAALQDRCARRFHLGTGPF